MYDKETNYHILHTTDGRIIINYNPPIKIKKVIFHNPATIIYWEDGTKTVVKVQDGDIYNKEKGMALCIAKKALGNGGNYNNEFHKWLKDE